MKIDIDKNSNFVIAADIGGTNVISQQQNRKKNCHGKKKFASYDPLL